MNDNSSEKEIASSVDVSYGETFTDVYVDKSAFLKAGKTYALRKKIIFGTAVTVVSVYLIMVMFCCFLFYPMTKIDGMDVSLMSPDYASGLICNSYEDYYITIIYRDGQEVIKASDIDLKVSLSENIREIHKSQNPFLWFSVFYGNNNYKADIQVSFDEDKLNEMLSDSEYLNEENMKMPDEPKIVLVDGNVEIDTGEEGNYIILDAFKASLYEAVYSLDKTFCPEEEGCYVKPEYTSESEEVLSALDKVNGYLESEIILTMGDIDIEVEKNDIFDMINIGGNYTVQLDKGKVRDYVLSLEEEYNTVGTERKFRTTVGDYIYVTGNNYGWDIDEDAETDELYTNIIDRVTIKREIMLSQKGFAYNKSGDIGKTYAEVDLSNQHMYLYQDGKMVFESDFVSGCIVEGHKTPGGLYYLKYKDKNVVLRGEDYETPVTYWMPFNRGIGFHDANWRSSFGGNIYVNNGSHGCINLPVQKAKELYNLIEQGTPVICYWR